MMRVGFFASLVGLACFAACSSTTKVTHEGSDAAAGADSGSSASGGQGGAGGSTGGSTGTTGGGSGTTGGSAGATGGSAGSAASGGSAGAATGGSGGSAGTAACPDATQVKGPSLVYIDGFCIDSTEVTNAQYEEFVNANTDPSGQISACAQNTFAPAQSWPPATDEFNQPVVYVDWCDAYAYCDWAGKRLCGRIGGGTNDFTAFADTNLSQWYRVCSNGGRNTYPYGGTYDAAKCNGWQGPDGCNGGTAQLCRLVDVGSYTQCQGVGAYAGVYDLSGNALEWEDSCTLDPTTNRPICRLRGGGIYAQATTHMACNYDGYGEGYDYTAVSIGFRCCYN